MAIIVVLGSVVGALGWFRWSARSKAAINFLPERSPAQWIVYPAAPDLVLRPRIEMSTVFMQSFVLEQAPASATLKVAGFHNYSVSINTNSGPLASNALLGEGSAQPLGQGAMWKEPDVWEVGKFLRVGTNVLSVTVLNSNGPPALWLSLDTGGKQLNSDGAWEASYAGAAWRNARASNKPKLAPVGNPVGAGETALRSLGKKWELFILFIGVVGLTLGAVNWKQWKAENQSQQPENRLRRFVHEHWPVLACVAFWIALFANNLGALPGKVGFDVDGHMGYIAYIQEHGSIPLAGQGWETFQPPLYYLLCFGLLKLLSLSISQPAGVFALRALGLCIGVAHFVIIWCAMRLIFPKQRARQFWGLLLAAFLPPLLYISQYISNEGLAAMLVSACVLVCLRILTQENASWRLYTALGFLIGLALLTKVTAVLVLAPILGALVWNWILKSRADANSLLGIALTMLIAAAVCGWHYARVWTHFGSPLLGGWEPIGQVGWWQDDGYQTAAYYGRFGEALRHPWFSGAHGFADGIYSTLWGDGLFGGNNDVRSRAPWSYELMAIGYWLALVPSVAIFVGAVRALAGFVRRPSAIWLLLFGLGFLVAVAVVQVSLTAPYHCMIKAFYGLSALVPFCACGAWGVDLLRKGVSRARKLQPIGLVSAILLFAIGIWAINSFASFWIERRGAAAALGRARDLIKEGHSDAAVPILKTSFERHPRDRETRYVLVPLLLGQGDLETASRLAEDFSRDNPEAAESHLVMGMVRETQQRAEEAVEETRTAIRLAPGCGVAHQQLAIILSQAKRYAACIAACQDALIVTPYNAEIRWCFGNALLSEQRESEANAQLQLACNLEQDRATAQSRWGQILADQGKTAEAVAHYQEALWLNSALPGALNNLAWIRAASPEAQFRNGIEAVDLAERACRVTRFDDPIYVGTLAAAYAEAGRFKEAETTATRARDLARVRGQNELAEKDEQLIKLFTNHQPFREPKAIR